MYYTSNERDYSTLSIDEFNFENTYGGRKLYLTSKKCNVATFAMIYSTE